MARVQPPWNPKKQQFQFLVDPMLYLPGTKRTFASNTNGKTNTTNADAYGFHGNGNVSSSSSGSMQILRVMDRQGIRPDSNTYGFLLDGCAKTKALAEGKLIHGHMIGTGFNPETFLGTKLVIMYANCGRLADARQVLDRMPKRHVVSVTAMISSYARHGYNEEALTLYRQMRREGIQPNAFTFASVLPVCANLAALKQGKEIHGTVITTGSNSNIFVGSALVDMYAKCGRTEDAHQVFDEMPERNVVSWNALIAGYAQNGIVDEAIKFFQTMPERNVVSWTALIVGYSESGEIEEALKFFQKMPERDVVSWNAMITGYAQNGYIDEALNLFWKIPEQNAVSWTAMIAGSVQNGQVDEALKLFQKMPERESVSWNAMIAGYAQNGYFNEALKLFRQMQLTRVKSDSCTLPSVLSACTNLAALINGKEVHGYIIRRGFESHHSVGSAVIDMYAKCGLMENACKVFEEMPNRNEVSWTAVIAGYAQNGHIDEARKFFQEMPKRNVVSWTAMITGYAQNGNVPEALTLFQKMPEKDEVSWNAIIAGYAQNGHCNEALKLFGRMQLTGVRPDSVTFTIVLPACGKFEALINGKQIHENTIKRGFQSNLSVGSALVDMYAKCGVIQDARKVFDEMPERNVISWTAMIAGYAQKGQVEEALQFFQEMPERNVVSWTAMIGGYAQNGQVDEALKLFQKMPKRDLVSWNTMMAGYIQSAHFAEALKLFGQIQLTGLKPDSVSFTTILTAYANFAHLINGRGAHGNIIRSGFQSYISVGNTLVDMYAKCGAIEDACQVFNKMLERDIVSWNAMILGYAKHGCGKEALNLFQQMQHAGIKPNHVTFIGVLSACSHVGLVDDGQEYFNRMSLDYQITPIMEHYGCMVDLLGRAGFLNEARDLINKMAIKPDAAVWVSLLNACRIYSNIELGECVAERLFELDPKNSACYVLLSNIYAAAGRWGDVEKVRKLMKDRRVKKIPGCSWVEVNNKVHSFLVKDRSHLETHKIYPESEILFQRQGMCQI